MQITPQRIDESRVSILDDDKVSRSPAALKLVLVLGGPEAEAATQYGRLKLEEAVDNTGVSLIPRADSFHDPAQFRDYANSFFRNSKFGGKSEPAKPQVEINLAMSKRAATKIARLRGSFELADGGKTNTVELAELTGGGKKTVPMPKDSPITVSVVVPEGKRDRSVSVETTGDESALASIEIVDANGKKISTGMSKWTMNGGPVQNSLGLSKPLDASMKLVVKVILDRKFTKVPFDLKGISLP